MIATIELEREESVCCDDDCCGDSGEKATGLSDENPEIKHAVKENYGRIAKAAVQGGGCACGCNESKNIAPDGYRSEDGYTAEADLGLGCGMPNQFADLQEGETVLDMGSGAGLDAFISRKVVGESGKVIGVDMTPAMVDLARANTDKLEYDNVEFRLGDLEQLPVDDSSVDVAISNCVFNLVPNKRKALSELSRVLRTGGRFSISDIVYSGALPQAVRESVNLYVGCVAGAVSLEDYLNMVLETGFQNVAVRSISTVDLDGFTANNADEAALAEFLGTGGRVLSVTVTGERV